MTFRTAVSGLRAAQTHLETIGNNVANANTTGFKQARAEFADIYATSRFGAARDQVGTGVDVSRIAQQFNQGNIKGTDNVLDLAIDGEGFFALEDAGTPVYSRAGAFSVDKDGFIVNAQNHRLVTYQPNASGGITDTRAPIQLTATSSVPTASTLADVRLNLDANSAVPTATPFDRANPDTYTSTTSMTIYDSLGNPHTASLFYSKTATANQWESRLFVDNTADPAGAQTLAFDTSGALTTPASGTLSSGVIPIAGADPLSLTFDYTGTTQYGSDFATTTLTQNGNPTGLLSGISIDSEGIISANFTQGQPQVQGQLVLASFQNPNGLQQLGNNSWSETPESGQVLANRPGDAGIGFIRSGGLEGSNVDLTSELVSLIIAQRNFQANAQVITTADSITQTVINIR